ncbi:MAG: hypothetical protein EGR29_08520 [Faecalibacterium prausnitzii]|nr:hypothetical protein [Faecalibacterium prausnitzii]
MKLKKFFAGVLAAAMMLTVGATAAFATELNTGKTDNNAASYTPVPDSTDLGIMKNYKVEKGTAPKEDFTFSVTYVPVKSKPYTTAYTGYDGTYTQPVASKTATASFKNDMDAKAENYQESLGIKISDFSLPKGPGKYCFEIKENVPTNKTPGVTYDETIRYLVITVANNDALDGGCVYFAQLYDDTYAPANSIKDKATGTKVDGDDAFTNTYTANNVVISKDIKGGLGDLAAKFNFTVKLSYANGKNAGQYVGAKVIDYTGETAGIKNLVWAIDGTTEHSISLGRNQSITLENLPEDVTVTVVETDGSEYTVTKSDDTTGTLSGSTITATISNVDGKIGFINTKEGTPDMGVVLDNAPYIAMLAIVAIGGVALMLNKRRRDEE